MVEAVNYLFQRAEQYERGAFLFKQEEKMSYPLNPYLRTA